MQNSVKILQRTKNVHVKGYLHLKMMCLLDSNKTTENYAC